MRHDIEAATSDASSHENKARASSRRAASIAVASLILGTGSWYFWDEIRDLRILTILATVVGIAGAGGYAYASSWENGQWAVAARDAQLRMADFQKHGN